MRDLTARDYFQTYADKFGMCMNYYEASYDVCVEYFDKVKGGRRNYFSLFFNRATKEYEVINNSVSFTGEEAVKRDRDLGRGVSLQLLAL